MNTVRKALPALALFGAISLAFAAPTAAQGLLGTISNTVGDAATTVTETVEEGSQSVNETVGGVLGSLEQTLGGGAGSSAASEQEFALQAVRGGRALPLEEMLFLAGLYVDGKVIDVHLVTARGILLYQLTFLAPDGEIFDTFFYAANGNPVRPSN